MSSLANLHRKSEQLKLHLTGTFWTGLQGVPCCRRCWGGCLAHDIGNEPWAKFGKQSLKAIKLVFAYTLPCRRRCLGRCRWRWPLSTRTLCCCRVAASSLWPVTSASSARARLSSSRLSPPSPSASWQRCVTTAPSPSSDPTTHAPQKLWWLPPGTYPWSLT